MLISALRAHRLHHTVLINVDASATVLVSAKPSHESEKQGYACGDKSELAALGMDGWKRPFRNPGPPVCQFLSAHVPKLGDAPPSYNLRYNFSHFRTILGMQLNIWQTLLWHRSTTHLPNGKCFLSWQKLRSKIQS